jgi:hypothetical protein
MVLTEKSDFFVAEHSAINNLVPKNHVHSFDQPLCHKTFSKMMRQARTNIETANALGDGDIDLDC